MTTGSGSKAQEILEESITPISEALKSRSDASRISSVYNFLTFSGTWSLNGKFCCSQCYLRTLFQLLECLAIITFIGGEEPEETEKSMQLMWQIIHPKMGPNVCLSQSHSPYV